MRYKSGILAVGSGSLGGVVFSHNAGGQYLRNRTTPTNPQTQFQTAVRGAMSNLTSRWRNILTEPEREAWRVYASNTPLLDVFGDSKYRTGLNHYVRSNVPRIQAGLDIIDAAPTIYNLGEFTMPSITASVATQKISLIFDNTDEWANEDDAYMLAYASRPQNDTIMFFKGPYRHYHTVAGDSGTPPVSPLAVDAPFAFALGQKIFVQVIVVRADGRLSTPVRLFCVAAA